MNLVSRLTAALVTLAAVVATGCGVARATESAPAFAPEVMLAPVAAEYRSTLRDGVSEARVSTWRFWRTAERIERENPTRQSGERWERDGATLFLTRLYHADRKGIEYRSDDLTILGAAPRWQQLALLIDPELLEQLTPEAATWRDGVPLRRYSGEVDGTRWDVTVRTDLMLPTSVVRTEDGRIESLELLRATTGEQAPWQPTPSEAYEIIDYADLGDRERDPFVMRITAEEGSGHGHAHAH